MLGKGNYEVPMLSRFGMTMLLAFQDCPDDVMAHLICKART